MAARTSRRCCGSYMGDTRGRWDGDTLVLDTINLTDKTGVGANGRALFHSAALRLTERFTRTPADTLQYSVTIDDPQHVDAAVDDVVSARSATTATACSSTPVTRETTACETC